MLPLLQSLLRIRRLPLRTPHILHQRSRLLVSAPERE